MVDVVGKAIVIVESKLDAASINKDGTKLGRAVAKGALVGGAALVTLAAAGIKAGLAFEEAEAKQRKLEQVLTNMGKSGAADAVSDLASNLQRVTGVDDEVIKGGETILATFSSVAESAGVMGGTFERATELSLDLAASGFGSVEGASKALGKALQDPEKGITALSRAGVTFTAAQKEMIANFVETGDVAAAQNLILAEVEKQVGGVAEAGARGSERLKTAFGEVNESIGGLLVSLFEGGKGKKSFIDIAADAMFDLSEAITEFQTSGTWRDLRSNMRSFGRDLGVVAGAGERIVKSLNSLSEKTTGSGLLNFLDQLDKHLNPLRRAVELAANLVRLYDKLRGNSDVPLPGNSVSQPRDTYALGGLVRSSGLALVGEQGPEIVNLPAGSYVHTASETRQALNDAGATITLIQNYYGPNSASEGQKDMEWALRYGTRFGSANASPVGV